MMMFIDISPYVHESITASKTKVTN